MPVQSFAYIYIYQQGLGDGIISGYVNITHTDCVANERGAGSVLNGCVHSEHFVYSICYTSIPVAQIFNYFNVRCNLNLRGKNDNF